jgi:hypothetical protein
MDEFWKAVATVDWTVPAPPEFRVYYDPDTGSIIEYTTEHRPGQFILVDRETFARNRFEPLIRDGKMTWPRQPIAKLIPDTQGTGCDPRDITIIGHAPHVQHWRLKTYEN